MELQYKIKAKQGHNPQLSSYTYTEDTGITIYKNFQGVSVEALGRGQGGFYRKTSKLVSNYRRKGNIIYGEDKSVKFNKSLATFKTVNFPLENVKDFVDTFRLNMTLVEDLKIDQSISLDENLEVVFVDSITGELNLLSKDFYLIDASKFKIELKPEASLLNINTLICLDFPSRYSYEKESDSVFFDVEAFLNIDSGFYKILPEKVLLPYDIKQTDFKFFVKTREILFLSSEFNLLYDKVEDSTFFIQPKTTLEISYDKQVLTPLVGKTFFNYEDDYSYIIYELQGTNHVPKYKLPLNAEDVNLKLLLQSHDEFKRPYSFLANKSKLTIKDTFNKSETLTIFNSNFNELYNNF